MRNVKTVGLWLAVFLALFAFISCDDVNDIIIETAAKTGYVTLSLAEDAEEAGRTIMPTTPSSGDFNGFTLEFTHLGTQAKTVVNRVRSELNEPIELSVGEYELDVAAYLDAVRTRLAARASLKGENRIVISDGEGTACVITLDVIIDNINDDPTATGHFRWHIPYNFGSSTVTAHMKVISRSSGNAVVYDEPLKNAVGAAELSGEHYLAGSFYPKVGYYNVIITLNDGGLQTAVIRDVLHVYRNLESVLDDLSLTTDYFNHTNHTVTLNYIDGNNTPGAKTVLHGEAVTAPDTPRWNTADTFLFYYWCSDAQLTTPYDFDEPVSDNLTLYAKWRGNLATATIRGAYTFNSTARTPTFNHNGNNLLAATNYTITSLTNNTNAGTASVTIEAVEGTDFIGTGNLTFTINKANPTVTWPTLAAVTYGANVPAIPTTGANAGSANGFGSGGTTQALSGGTFEWVNGSSTFAGNAGTQSHSMRYTPSTANQSNYNSVTSSRSITVNVRSITLTVGAMSGSLSPVDTTATFNVRVSSTGNNAIVGTDLMSIGLAENSYGLSLSDNTDIGATDKAVTLIYNGTAEVARTSNTGVTINLTNTNPNYSLSAVRSIVPVIYDGQAKTAFRAIPVTTANINRAGNGFTTYANNNTGRARHYRLTEDVTLQVVSGSNNWNVIGTSSNSAFSGSFDGDNHTITSLTSSSSIAGSGIVVRGMFGYLTGTVEKLGLNTPNIYNQYNNQTYVGGIAGYVNGGTVQNCYVVGGSVGGNNNIIGATTTHNIGGVAGYVTNGGTVQNCYVTSTVQASFISDAKLTVYLGGVVGTIDGGTVQNCYTNIEMRYGLPTTALYVGGVVGRIMGSNNKVQYCYATGSIMLGNANTFWAGGIVGTSNTQVVNCIALNSSILIQYNGPGYVRRVMYQGGGKNNYGRTVGTNTGEMKMGYNVAASGTGGTSYTPTSDLTGQDGLTTTSYNTSTFWTTPGNWDTAAWSVGTGTSNIWQWNSTTSLPILRNMPTAANQNHTVQ